MDKKQEERLRYIVRAYENTVGRQTGSLNTMKYYVDAIYVSGRLQKHPYLVCAITNKETNECFEVKHYFPTQFYDRSYGWAFKKIS